MERNKLTRLPRRITSLFMAMVMVLSLLVGFSTTSYANESQLSYSSSDNVITVTDNNGTPDDSSDDKTATYTLTAEDVDYNGKPHGALVTLTQDNPDNPITGIPAANTVQISYQDLDTETDTDSAPVNSGYYLASITIGQETASVYFGISGRGQDTQVEAETGLFYTGEAQNLVTVTPGHGTVEYCVQTQFEPSSLSFSETVPKATDEGTYYVFYRILGNSGYYSYGYDGSYQPYVTVTIHEALPKGISISNYKGTYDGQAHGINVDLNNSGATIKYSLSPNDSFDDSAPTVTDVNDNPKTVYWVLYTDDQSEPITGSNTIKINPKELTVKWTNTTVDKEAIRDSNAVVDWENSLSPKPTVEGKVGNDSVSVNWDITTITEEGSEYPPEYVSLNESTLPGIYRINVRGLAGSSAGNYRLASASATTTYTLTDSYEDAKKAYEKARDAAAEFMDEGHNDNYKNYPEIVVELNKEATAACVTNTNASKKDYEKATADLKEALEGAKNAIAFIEAAKKIPAAEKVTLDDVASVRAADEALENVPVAFLEAIPKNAEHKKITDNFAAALKKITELIKAEDDAKKAAEEAAKKEAEEAARKAAEEEARKTAEEEARKAAEEEAKKNAKIEVPNWTVYKGNVVAVDKNGKVVKKTGVATWKGYNLLIANGVLYKKPAFFQDKATGKYKYFVNGIQAKTGDTFVNYGGRLLRVTNGELNQETGFVKFGGKYYISYKGVAATFFTGTVTIKGYKVKAVKGVVVGISK